MAVGRIKSTELSAIAAAIRSKNGESTIYKPAEMAQAILDIPTGTTPTGTVNITQNGTTDVTQYASAAVNVPNSYADGDEGKVVQSGALVAQTARSAEITENGTYDTTNNNEVVVNVSGGSGDDDWTALKNYLESSGTQYIDTGYIPNDNTKLELVVECLANTSYSCIFGCRNTSGSGQFCFERSNGDGYVDLHGSTYTRIGSISDYTNRKIKITKLINGSKMERTDMFCSGGVYSDAAFTAAYSLVLFGRMSAGSVDALAKMKLYRCRIYESETLLHEFVPWQDGNNAACLKDTITGNLKYNAGTGAFTYGTDS